MSRVILFGSYARQEATEDSDIDILIVLKDPVNASVEIDCTSEFIAQLCLDHNRLISRLFMPQSRYETENSPLLRNIRQEGEELQLLEKRFGGVTSDWLKRAEQVLAKAHF